MRKLAVVLMAGALAASTLAGCGSSTAFNTQANTTATPADKENIKAQGAQSEAQGAQSEAGNSGTPMTDNSEKTIYVIVKVSGSQYWSIPQAGAEQAGKDLGCKVAVMGTALESDIEGQLILLQSAVSAQTVGIVITPLDSVSLDTPITEACNSGAPVVLMDTVTKSDNYSAALLTNNAETEKTAAEEMIRRLKARGLPEDEAAQIAIQVSSIGPQTIDDRIKGFNKYQGANVPEERVVLNNDIEVDEGDISKVVGFCQDSITTYPDLKGVFGPNNGSTVGFVTGLTESKRTGITMVGFDFFIETETVIRSNGYDVAFVVQRQYFMGYDGVKTAAELANGQTVEGKIIDTGVVPMDSKNVDFDEIQGIVHPQMIP